MNWKPIRSTETFAVVASDLGDRGILQKLQPSVTELNTYLAQESEKLKEDPGEGELIVSPAAAPQQQGESAYQRPCAAATIAAASLSPSKSPKYLPTSML